MILIIRQRLRAAFPLFVMLFSLVLLRLFYLQVIQHRFLMEKSQEQRTQIIEISGRRGDILDRNGVLLATSIDSYSVFSHKGRFAWVKRKLPLAEAEALRQTDPANLFIVKEQKRVYPNGRLAAQVIGFVGSDNLGLAGIERSWEKQLGGKKGRVVTERDTKGRELYGALREIEPAEEGMNVTLSLDLNLQYIAERELTEQIKKFKANSGQLLVMDAKNGELLVVASKPDYDPNKFAEANPRLWHPRLLDPYEPGSTFKLIAVAAGLEEGVINPDSRLKALEKIELGGRVIGNSHPIKGGGPYLTVSQALEESINTAMVQIGQKMGAAKFYQRIKKFGFGTTTGFGLEGESRGILRYWERWCQSDLGMITFGQSIAVTPLQLLGAVAAFGNEGRPLKPRLVKKIESQDGSSFRRFSTENNEAAVSPKTAKEMLALMRNVVLYGSGRRASLESFTVGGKTGTAQKAAPRGGYLKGKYIASFVGIAPLQDPRLVALVIVDEPQGSIWGETVCAPVFKSVVEQSLRYLNARPDVI